MEVPTFAVGTGFHSGGLTEGHQIFVDALTRFAEQSHNSRLTPIIGRVAAPRRIAVMGRDGVGRGAALARLAAADRPIVAVLNKADLTSLGDGGPLTRAHRRAADIARGSLRLVGRAR